ncbi:MAG: class I fructose-bisphosphate aldolase family protein [Thermoplasmata archaeon]|nr:MAG: class I fructose-bisphosphate aldolase family protein [Thermoplasmata archaeon]
MAMEGKKIRLNRIRDKKTGQFVIVPIDHGVTAGPIKGTVDMAATIGSAYEGGATAVVVHKGMAEFGLEHLCGDIGFILHLSASTQLGPDPTAKVLVSTVEEALQLGADAVSVHINVGAETEKDMLTDLGFVSNECREWNVPLLAMMYPRGPDITDPYDVELVKHVARLGAELGADIIKTNYTGNVDTFMEVTKGCPVPVIIAGGPKVNSDREVLQMVYDAMKAGAAGISIGRNIFQHDNVKSITKAISRIILEGIEVEDAETEVTG